MHPVKNMGRCGAVWAFAASTAAEGMLAIRDGRTQTGENAQPYRLSEQQAIDCVTQAYGCYGGFMANAWDYWSDIGAMSNDDWPYTATHRNGCRLPTAENKLEFVKDHGVVTGSISEIISHLADGPLSVAVSAGNECWRYYAGGILTEDMGCPTDLDFAAVLVGFHEDPSTPILDCTTYSVYTCRRARESEKKGNKCSADSALQRYIIEKNGNKLVSSCCGYKEEDWCEVIGEIEGEKYWTVQNSWS